MTPSRTYHVTVMLLAIPAFVWSVPTLWMLSLSLQPNDVLTRTTSSTLMGLAPIPFTIQNYVDLLSSGETLRWFFNSILVATGMTAGVLLVSSTAGYALARLDFPFKTAISFFF